MTNQNAPEMLRLYRTHKGTQNIILLIVTTMSQIGKKNNQLRINIESHLFIHNTCTICLGCFTYSICSRLTIYLKHSTYFFLLFSFFLFKFISAVCVCSSFACVFLTESICLLMLLEQFSGNVE